MSLIEDFVINELSRYFFDKDTVSNFILNYKDIHSKKSVATKKRIASLKGQISANKAKINNLMATLAEGCEKSVREAIQDNIETLTADNKRLSKDLRIIQRELSEEVTAEQVYEVQKKFAGYIRSKNNLANRKELLQKLIERIIISNDDVQLFLTV